MAQPWKTKKWFVSPWCYLPEARKGFKFAPKIKIHDVTLRDGEQQTGWFSVEKKRWKSPSGWTPWVFTGSRLECPRSHPRIRLR